MRPLRQGEEVRLAKPSPVPLNFNPYYGLIVEDHVTDQAGALDRDVTVLWETGEERLHRRSDLTAYLDFPLP
jgi:hypothetical protein